MTAPYTVEDLLEIAEQMEQKISERGFLDADVEILIHYISYAPFVIRVRAKDFAWDGMPFPDFKVGPGEPVQKAIDAAWHAINNAKTPEEARKERVIRDLGRLIDDARDVGFDVEFLNPLEEAMKQLSENIIEDKPLVA